MKINDYVRTKDGISRYTQDNNIFGTETIGNDRYFLIRKSEIVKSSPNIIDLIEVGDIITTNNLCGEVTAIDIDKNKIWTTCYDGEYCRFEDIKSIVTKEQFESMEYKVGEDNENE